MAISFTDKNPHTLDLETQESCTCTSSQAQALRSHPSPEAQRYSKGDCCSFWCLLISLWYTHTSTLKPGLLCRSGTYGKSSVHTTALRDFRKSCPLKYLSPFPSWRIPQLPPVRSDCPLSPNCSSLPSAPTALKASLTGHLTFTCCVWHLIRQILSPRVNCLFLEGRN